LVEKKNKVEKKKIEEEFQFGDFEKMKVDDHF
jgi:hypothetical protein